jgi:hypothetical protein
MAITGDSTHGARCRPGAVLPSTDEPPRTRGICTICPVRSRASRRDHRPREAGRVGWPHRARATSDDPATPQVRLSGRSQTPDRPSDSLSTSRGDVQKKRGASPVISFFV